MNENAKKWVKALRSGEYKQGYCSLAPEKYAIKGSGYCCLGVACELYQKEHPGWEYLPQSARLPGEVRDWLGLRDLAGIGDDVSLTILNDAKVTFARIADIIESEPAGLFITERKEQ